MKKIIIPSGIFFLVLSCNFFGAANPAHNSSIATQVSEQLTASPIIIASNTPETATETPAPTNTDVSTPTITLTSTLSPDDPRKNLGEPTWKETFNKPNQNFLTIENDPYTRFAYENGSLTMTAKTTGGWTGWSMSYPKPKNFYLEATFKTGQCAGDDRYGIVFRAPNFEDGYFFGINCDGKYSLRIYSQKGTLIPWTSNPAINPGSDQVNRIGILALDDRYAFYANGRLLQGTMESTFIEPGLFGVFIAASNTPNFTVTMDEISYWNK